MQGFLKDIFSSVHVYMWVISFHHYYYYYCKVACYSKNSLKENKTFRVSSCRVVSSLSNSIPRTVVRIHLFVGSSVLAVLFSLGWWPCTFSWPSSFLPHVYYIYIHKQWPTYANKFTRICFGKLHFTIINATTLFHIRNQIRNSLSLKVLRLVVRILTYMEAICGSQQQQQQEMERTRFSTLLGD